MYQAHSISGVRHEEVADFVRICRLGWSSMRRHKGLIALVTAAAMSLAALYVTWRPEAYTASSRILVDNRVLALQQQDAIYSVSSLTSQLLQSQVEILHSENIARRVIDQLGLLDDRDFQSAPSRSRSLLAGGAAPEAGASLPEDTRNMNRALRSFQKRLSVDEVGQSYVIEIRMTSSDPQKAAKITNALVTAYLEDQAAANASVAQSASGWLRNRLQNLGTTARVLTPATAPLEKDGPGASIILAFAAFCGLTVGTGLAFSRDLFSRRLRTPNAVQAVSGVECFGALPTIEAKGSLISGWRSKRRPAHENAPHGWLAKSEALDWSVERPRSMFAHNLRRARAALFEGRSSAPIIVGITSALPGEGKTVVAANLARLAAMWGRKVLLIDAMPYNAALTRLLAPQAEAGLRDAVAGAPLAQIILRDRWTDMHFLPGATDRRRRADRGVAEHGEIPCTDKIALRRRHRGPAAVGAGIGRSRACASVRQDPAGRPMGQKHR